MGNLPTKDCQFEFGTARNPSINNDATDIIHYTGQDGLIKGWIDSDGNPQGSLSVPGPAGANGTNGAQGPAGSLAATSGPSPWIDITAFGARAVTLPEPNTTVSINSGSKNATLGAASTFQNGDGVVLYGAGATNALATPSAPTVTPSQAAGATGTGIVVNSAAAGTTYNYQIVARTKNGGLTAASSVGSSVTGASALGLVDVAITSMTRSNQTVTVLTAPHTAAVGAVVYIHGSDDATFSGYFKIATVPDNTHFTFLQGMDTRFGASASSTGGTARIYVCNHLSWSAVPNAWQYYIYGRTGATLTLIGVSRPGELVFDDFGSPMMDGITLPSYVPTSPAPSVATNDYLSTTIVSGAGTTSIVLADAVSQTVSGAVIKFDNAPAFRAAATVAVANGTRGTLHISTPAVATPAYVINSYLVLPSGLSIWQSGPVTVNETVEFGSNITWFGDIGAPYGNSPQFGWGFGAQVNISAANPGLYGTAGGGQIFRGLYFSAKNQGLIMLMDGAAGFDNIWEKVSFNIGSGGADYMGMGVILRGVNQNVFNFCSFSVSDSAEFGSSLTPLLFLRNDLTNVNGAGSFSMDHPFFTGRSVAVDSTPPAGGGIPYFLHFPYAQAARCPMISFTGARHNFIHMDNGTQDTSPAAYIANWGADLDDAELITMGAISGEVGGRPGMVTGNIINSLRSSVPGGGATGQNTEFVNVVGNTTLTTTASATDTITMRGVTPSSHVSITPTNAAAAADMAGGHVYVSAKSANSITITHSANSGMTFDILATVN